MNKKGLGFLSFVSILERDKNYLEVLKFSAIFWFTVNMIILILEG